ncbi:hypothetical protein [Calothrix sp. UHCC 0171]|uniref:hypothetical protein n=1 Tax=Calothrix sp. UHCC 0171 TaxID=3110245 RepID=UPI002B1F6791|nr:hypothetical protein [Calothrix sp. UHCC 0171]MEA5570054.1 hypothetical protein [Calothrix sp. UHCC 0171]
MTVTIKSQIPNFKSNLQNAYVDCFFGYKSKKGDRTTFKSVILVWLQIATD